MIKILRSCSGRILDIIPDINDSGGWGSTEDWINVYVWIEDVKLKRTPLLPHPKRGRDELQTDSVI